MAKRVQRTYLKRLDDSHKLRAERELVRRVHELSFQHSLPYERVYVRNQRSLWGSCTSKGTVNLNLNLIQLNGQMIDYVVLHELTHVSVRNHGPQFWSALSKVFPLAKQIDRELRRICLT